MKRSRLLVAATMLMAVCSGAMADPLPSCAAPGFTPPKATNKHVADEYPTLSAMMGEEGTTVVRMVIGPDGSVTSATVKTSSGSLRLDDASIASIIGKWTYTPPLAPDKTPTSCVWEAALKWVLHGNSLTLPAGLQQMAIQKKAADYPAGARSRKEQGFVGLIVLRHGGDKQVFVMRSSGYPELDAAAVRIIKERLNLPPAEFDGKPVETSAILVVVWSLDAEPKQPTPRVSE